MRQTPGQMHMQMHMQMPLPPPPPLKYHGSGRVKTDTWNRNNLLC